MSILTDELKRAKRRTTKQNNMSTFKLLVKEQRVTEMERQVQAINVDVVSHDLISLNFNTEAELYDHLIDIGTISIWRFIMEDLCPRQRAELFERVSVLDAYELNEMSEREYMAEYKFQLYNQYLSQQ
jgi:hypothetical protein